MCYIYIEFIDFCRVKMNTHGSKSNPETITEVEVSALGRYADVWTEHVERLGHFSRAPQYRFSETAGIVKGKTVLDAAARGIQYRIFARWRENDRHRYFSPADCTCAAGRKAGTLGIR